ncbi:MAG TPA: ribbon-helix-helix domain-containing protein [Woeseiaceae bacterium]
MKKDAMPNDTRVVTANLPVTLVKEMDAIAARMERSKSWIIKQALFEWVADEQRRHEMTLEALKAVDEGRTYTQREVEEMAAEIKASRRARTSST